MKNDKLITSFKVLFFSLVFVFISCIGNQSIEIIALNKGKTNNKINELLKEKVISLSESTQINKRLNDDYDYYLEHQNINSKDIQELFSSTVKSFENIKINQQVYTLVSEVYLNIATQRMMKGFPLVDMSIREDLVQVMNDWFEKYQSDGDIN